MLASTPLTNASYSASLTGFVSCRRMQKISGENPFDKRRLRSNVTAQKWCLPFFHWVQLPDEEKSEQPDYFAFVAYNFVSLLGGEPQLLSQGGGW